MQLIHQYTRANGDRVIIEMPGQCQAIHVVVNGSCVDRIAIAGKTREIRRVKAVKAAYAHEKGNEGTRTVIVGSVSPVEGVVFE